MESQTDCALSFLGRHGVLLAAPLVFRAKTKKIRPGKEIDSTIERTLNDTATAIAVKGIAAKV